MTDLPLFASAASERDAEMTQLRERLKTLAGELALRAGRHGVTIGDVRITAQNRNWMTGQESKAYLAALDLPSLLTDAGLCKTQAFRRSSIGRSHGNPHVVYVMREWSEAVA